MALPNPGMVIEQPRTALVITDLQNDFLSPGGAAWELMKERLQANKTVENLEALFQAAADGGYPVIISSNDEGDGYQSAMVNFRFMAHALWTTRQTVDPMRAASTVRSPANSSIARTPAA